jgi:4-hydroxy-3-methylbut-2-en-1-yl diphosphate synthase IspG/GcpE
MTFELIINPGTVKSKRIIMKNLQQVKKQLNQLKKAIRTGATSC